MEEGKSAAPQPDNSATKPSAAFAPIQPMAYGPTLDPVVAFIVKWPVRMTKISTDWKNNDLQQCRSGHAAV
jgi:hypothetical protein